MHKAGLKIAEIPSVERPRLFGQSNLRTFRDGWRVLKMIVKERMALGRPEKKKIPILMYHSISNHASPKFKQFTVSPKVFAEHMSYLHQHRYTPMTVTQFVAAQSQDGARLPERPVVLTLTMASPIFIRKRSLYSDSTVLFRRCTLPPALLMGQAVG